MNIKFKYLGRIAEVTGKDEEVIEFSESINLSAIKADLENRYSGLKSETFNFAVNLEMTDLNTEIADSCEVAVLPPFAGG